jgi:hypothetical protein
MNNIYYDLSLTIESPSAAVTKIDSIKGLSDVASGSLWRLFNSSCWLRPLIPNITFKGSGSEASAIQEIELYSLMISVACFIICMNEILLFAEKIENKDDASLLYSVLAQAYTLTVLHVQGDVCYRDCQWHCEPCSLADATTITMRFKIR